MIRSVAVRLQVGRFARELALIGGAYLLYTAVRAAVAGRATDAMDNATLVVRMEQGLGIFSELSVQAFLLSYDALIHFLSLWYVWGHLPLIIVFALWAFYRHRQEYCFARNAIFIAGGIALIGYLTFPVAPPRLLPGAGFQDTLQAVLGISFKGSRFVNEFAAMPSMHAGFALIVGVTGYRVLGGGKGLALMIGLPTVMVLSIVATGNHYYLDAVLGVPVAVAGMLLAARLARIQPRVRAAARRRLGMRPALPPPVSV